MNECKDCLRPTWIASQWFCKEHVLEWDLRILSEATAEDWANAYRSFDRNA